MAKLDIPIFDLISKFVKNELDEKQVRINRFRRWEEASINAAGFEVVVDISPFSDITQELVINWDWDIFREVILARQLQGMKEHPLLKDSSLFRFDLEPTIDIEISWKIMESRIPNMVNQNKINSRVDNARFWMENVNAELRPTLQGHDLINRWHVELDGDINGKFISNISLISYLQYSFTDLNQLEQIQRYLSKKLQLLLVLNGKILRSLNRMEQPAA